MHSLNRTIRSVALAAAVAAATASVASAGLPDLFGGTPIVEAVRKGSVEDTNKAIIDGAAVHTRAPDGSPLIVMAAAGRNLEIVKILIENGARPDDRHPKDNSSALTVAAANGDLAIVTYLLDHKAEIDLPGALRETALIKAARGHHNEVVKLLLERGADRDETDASGATAPEIAERAGWKDTVALFQTKKATTK
jgi:ankyrin repeat protein